MSKRKQRRSTNQRVVINPYHVRHTGTVLPMPDEDYLTGDVERPLFLTMLAIGLFMALIAILWSAK